MIPENNFCRVYELPEVYPEGYCFGGGIDVEFKMVDWFQPWPNEIAQLDMGGSYETWADVEEMLLEFCLAKNYLKPGRSYILITDFGKSMMFEAPE